MHNRHMENRTNRLAAVHVDLSVNIADCYGIPAGVTLLLDYGIVWAVVQRVLIDGGPRRGATSTKPGGR